jgi:P-type Ca2+ transporter type 2C
VIRDGINTVVSTEDVVPGDVVVLQPGPACADMIIVESDHVLVDESALTGEPNPIPKIAIDSSMANVPFELRRHSTFVISAGTEILEAGGSGLDLGLVLSTGSYTSKGALLADVFSYGSRKTMFDDEIKIVLSILLVEAVILLSMVFHWLGGQWMYAWFFGK